MAIPNTYKFRRLVKKLRKHDIEWRPDQSKGSHGAFVRTTAGKAAAYTIPNSEQKEIRKTYIVGLLKRFGLKEEDVFGE